MISVEDFVRDTLLQITKAVSSFEDEKNAYGASANPVLSGEAAKTMAAGYDGRPIIQVDFDIAVVANETQSNEAGAKVSVASFVGIGGKLTDETQTSVTSRVSFKLPLRLNDTHEHSTNR